MKPWTIQVFYSASDDNGRSFRATTAFHSVGEDQGEAYDYAEEVFKGKDQVKFGFILPGHHNMLPGMTKDNSNTSKKKIR